MDSSDIKVGDLMAVVTMGLHKTKAGEYIFGHVTDIKLHPATKKDIFFIMWDNGNAFWYNRQEIQKYKNVIDTFRNT